MRKDRPMVSLWPLALSLAGLVLVAGCVSERGERGEKGKATETVAEKVTAAVKAGKRDAFNVRAFGAVGNGTNLDHQAINRAIDACAAAGGGTVLVPAGTYLCGSIRLKSNINLLIDAGAVILGAPQSANAYDPAEPFEGRAYQDGGHTFFHNSLIWGEGLTNVSITGTGMINGGGLSFGDGQLDRLDGFGAGNTNDFARPFVPSRTAGSTNINLRVGNKAIALKLCRHVLIRDVTIYHGGHFAILVTGCQDMTVDNVTMDTNRDGIDIDCCKNTVVSNCRINSPRDDALCPKSSFALGTNVITENLTIVNCQVSGFMEGTLLDGTMVPAPGGNGRIKMGTEANGGFRNITIANCTFRACKGLALEEVDGGIMENITINNLTMMDAPQYGIYITLGSRNRGPKVTAPSRGRNILIANVIAEVSPTRAGPPFCVEIEGSPDNYLEGVRLENIWMVNRGDGTPAQASRTPRELGTAYPEPGAIGTLPAYGIYARHVRGLELSNFRFSYVTADSRPAIVCSDVDGLEIDNFKAQVAEGVAAAKFEAVKGLVIRNSPVLEQAK